MKTGLELSGHCYSSPLVPLLFTAVSQSFKIGLEMVQRCVVRADVQSKNPSLRVFHFLFLLMGGHVMELAEVSKRSVGEEVEAREVWGFSGRGDECVMVVLCDVFPFILHNTHGVIVPH